MLFREHNGVHYVVQSGYLVREDAWMLELSEAQPAPEHWTSTAHLPGKAFLTALVPDEDPGEEPSLHLFSPEDRLIPYEVMRWFFEFVDAEVSRCRAEMNQAKTSPGNAS
jgi:hypothetical protein